jgi:hypothetical protein
MGCRARAAMLARFTDNQGRPLRQRELCIGMRVIDRRRRVE